MRVLGKFPKKLLLVAASAILALIPVATAVSQAQQVQIEARLGVANFTQQEPQYRDATNAQPGDVVKFQVWYHNKEADNSGKIANNLSLDVDMPTQAGKTQTVKATVKGSNTNTVVDTAQVNLPSDEAFLEFIPGSVDWRHNTGTNQNPNWVTDNISDQAITGAQPFVLENAKPCFNFEASVTFFARVKIPGVSLTKQVRKAGETQWKFENTARAGETLEYQMTIRNTGNTVVNNIILADQLPQGVTYVPGSTFIKDGNNPGGVPSQSDTITQGGINMGNLGVTGVSYVKFQAKVNDSLAQQCGEHVLVNKAAITTNNAGSWNNSAKTVINVVCAQKQFECRDLAASPTVGKPPLNVNFTASAQVSDGVSVQGYIFDFGDGGSQVFSTSPSVSHTYNNEGTFTASVVVRTSEGDTPITEACKAIIKVSKQPVPPPEQPPQNPPSTPPTPEAPTTLVNTGIESMAAGAVGSGGLGIAIRAYLRSRRSLIDTLLDV
jgi:uncharacterized repeat protein (TIGR01451 family)